GFENGWEDWSVQGSVWQIGKPTSGPGAAHSGTNCAATILNGNYPNYADARLISPAFAVPSAGQQPRLRFWSWHQTAGAPTGGAGDYGQLQIRTNGGAWVDVTEPLFGHTGGAWMQRMVDLTAYGGQN